MNGEIVWAKAGRPKIPLTDDLFNSADGKMYRGNINNPDDCPRCKWRNGCPTGQLHAGLGTHRCNVGIFEPGEPETQKVRWGRMR